MIQFVRYMLLNVFEASIHEYSLKRNVLWHQWDIKTQNTTHLTLGNLVQRADSNGYFSVGFSAVSLKMQTRELFLT